MKKGETITAYIKHVEFPNKGVCYTENGEKVIVKGTLPGQKIKFTVTKARKGKVSGRLISIEEPSELETEKKKCPHFGQCGGCSYQTLPYETQVLLKEQQVKHLLEDVVPDIFLEETKKSPISWAYRNKMEFSFGDEYKDGPLALGLHKKDSFYDLLTADCCQIVHEDFNKIVSCVLNYFRKTGLPYYHRISHEGYLRHLLVRRAVKTGELLVACVTTGWKKELEVRNNSGEEIREEDIFSGMKDELLQLSLSGKLVGILHVINNRKADVIEAEQTELLYGQDFFIEELLGLQFKISTFSFFQTNSLGAEVLYSKIREFVGETKDKIIFDLYSGTGTIAQILAPVAKKVVGIEIVEEAVKAARENAIANGLTNIEFLVGDVLKVIDNVTESPDLIVLDPPRDGLHPKALEKICENIRCQKIVYISCKPTSLARDLVKFQEYGYKVERICCVDMFPQTVHVETTCLLVRKP